MLRMKGSKTNPISWKALFVEVVLIVLGLSLALMANEWREGRKDQRLAEAAMKSISRELQANQTFLENRVPYYEALVDSVVVILEAEGPDAAIRPIPGWRGLQPPLLRSSSYQAALATQAFVHVDYQLVDVLSQVYAVQDVYRLLIEKYVDLFLSDDLDTMREMRTAFQDLASLGREVMGAYQMAMTTIPEEFHDDEVESIFMR